MDTTQLAQAITTFLAPFLPYLVKGGIEAGKSAAQKLGEKFSEDTWEKAKTLWGKLRPKIEAEPAAKDAVQKVITKPGDKRAKAALELQIEDILEEDSGLAYQVAEMWEEIRSTSVTVITSGERSVAIGGDATDSVIVTGDQNLVQRGKYNINIGKAKGTAIGDNARVDVNNDADDK